MTLRFILLSCLSLSIACSGEECRQCQTTQCGDNACPPSGDSTCPPPGDSGPGDTLTGDTLTGDDTSPFEVTELPRDGSVGNPTDVRVTLTFSRAITPATLTVQADTGACDAGASLQISHDDFTTCFGGTLSSSANPVAEFTPKHGLFVANRTYKIKVTTAVEDAGGAPLAAQLLQATGFATGRPLCTANTGFIDAAATGAVCLPTDFVDNGDGTITDRANGLLWLQCTLDIVGNPLTGDCAYNPSNSFNAWTNSGAVIGCEDLVFAGRDDWILPDVARLQALIDPDAVASPYMDATYFPNPRTTPPLASYHTTSNFDTDTNWQINFSTGEVLNRDKQTFGWTRCVADNPDPVAPVVSELRPFSVTTTLIRMYNPVFDVTPTPFATVEAFLGVDGTISLTDNVVTNYLQNHVLAIDQRNVFVPDFTSLTPDTSYRIIMVAENAAGYSTRDTVMRTGDVAPDLAPLDIVRYDKSSITLARPSFRTHGYPAPTVWAHIGLDGIISVAGNTVSGADWSADVAAEGTTFTSLTSNAVYRIIVVAENTTGYSVAQTTQWIGSYIAGEEAGMPTIYDPATGLSWERCSRGQRWRDYEESCQGDAERFSYCTVADNSCNGGSDTGLLQPPFDIPNGIYSSPYERCNGSGEWRVPTVDELLTLVDDDAPGGIDYGAFPNTSLLDYMTANSASETTFCIVDFARGYEICDRLKASSTGSTAALRCVKSGQ